MRTARKLHADVGGLRILAGSATVLIAVGLWVVLGATRSHRTARHVPPTFAGDCRSTSGYGDLTAKQLGSYNHLLVRAPDRLQAVTDPILMGTCTIRINIKPGDVGGGQTDRAEITGTRTLWRNGDDVWYLLSFMLGPTNPLPAPGGWMLVDQFFAQDSQNHVSGGSPPFAVEVVPAGGIDVDVRGGAKASESDPAPRINEYHVAPATPGVWHSLLIHIKWSTANDGLVEVWHRQGTRPFPSAPQVSARGPNLLTVAGDVLPVYAETGIYRSRTTTDQTVYYAGLFAEPTRSAALKFAALQTKR